MPDQRNPGPPSIVCSGGSPPKIPDYEILRLIGRGSYGEVWLARNMMGAFRAVKVVHRKNFETARPFERELAGIRKFEPISRSYDGFIDILHIGQSERDGCFYYVMEIGDDATNGPDIVPETYSPRTLAHEKEARGRLPWDRCLNVAIQLAGALSDLHRNELIHRDIKPSNILFVNGVPKLADIGLVAGISDAPSLVGTDGYIPPEGPGTVQADLFSLGKVLYEIFTGKDRHDFPELPTFLGEESFDSVYLEINEVILKACHTDFRKRYSSAKALENDLAMIKNGQSVRRLHDLERGLAKLKRGALLTLVLCFFASPIVYSFLTARKQKENERQRQLGMHVANGSRSIDQGDFLGALPEFIQALALDSAAPARVEQYRLGIGTLLAESPRLRQIFFLDRRPRSVEFSPDEQTILAACHWEKAHILDLLSGKENSPCCNPATGLAHAAFSPDGTRVLTASEANTAQLWDAASGKTLREFPHPARVFHVAFNRAGDRFVTACQDKLARVWNSDNGSVVHELAGHSGAVFFAAFSKSGKLIVTCSEDGTAQIWDADSGRPIGGPLKHKNWVYAASFSPNEKRVMTASADRTARIWEVRSSHEILPPMVHNDAVRSAEFSPDGARLLTGSLDGTARLWDAETHQPAGPVAVLKHSDRVTQATFNRDGNQVLTACIDGTIRIWELASMAPKWRQISFFSTNSGLEIQTNEAPVLSHYQQQPSESVLFDRGKVLVRQRRNESVLEFWNVQTKQLDATVPFRGSLETVSFVPGLNWAAWGQGGSVEIYDLSARKTIVRVSVDGNVSRTALSPGNERLLIGLQHTIVLADTNGRILSAPIDLRRPISHLEFSPDGELFATATSDSTLDGCSARVWSARNGAPVSPPLQHKDGVRTARFSPDSKLLVTASEDSTAIVWDAQTGRVVRPAFSHLHGVSDAMFSPDGKWLFTLAGELRVWDSETGIPITPPIPTGRAEHFEIATKEGVLLGGNVPSFLRVPMVPAGARIDQLEMLAFFLNGFDKKLLSSNMPEGLSSYRSAWEALRRSFPSQMVGSPEQLARWHEHAGWQCQREQDWEGALFHWARLAELRPREDEIMILKETAIRKLAATQ